MKKQSNDKSRRRSFLKSLLSFGLGTVVVSSVSADVTEKKEETVKMLTPDGKLVEVKKSQLTANSSSGRATDQEVLSWMNAKK